MSGGARLEEPIATNCGKSGTVRAVIPETAFPAALVTCPEPPPSTRCPRPATRILTSARCREPGERPREKLNRAVPSAQISTSKNPAPKTGRRRWSACGRDCEFEAQPGCCQSSQGGVAQQRCRQSASCRRLELTLAAISRRCRLAALWTGTLHCGRSARPVKAQTQHQRHGDRVDEHDRQPDCAWPLVPHEEVHAGEHEWAHDRGEADR